MTSDGLRNRVGRVPLRRSLVTLCVLAVLATAARGSMAQSQKSEVKFLYVHFLPGNETRDGYEVAQMQVRYRFMECFGGQVAVLHQISSTPLQAARFYWFRGARHLLPEWIAPVVPSSFPQRDTRAR